jgi:MerR family transcriptional regulator, thiopeptide resistance regulator
MERLYRVGELAALTGVSIRTLHHYDRIGLVHPSSHSEGGHRLYSAGDVLRLQQVLTLRYLGFPLAEIRELLARPEFDLVASIRIQRGALRDRIAELERIEAVLAELLERRRSTGRWAWELVVEASAAVQGGLAQGRGEKMKAYYTPEQLKRFEELAKEVPVEERQAIEQGWTALLAELRANRDLDPASPSAQALAERWNQLSQAVAEGFRGNPDLWEAIGDNYRHGRFDGVEGAPQAEDFAFIARVNEAREGGGGDAAR